MILPCKQQKKKNILENHQKIPETQPQSVQKMTEFFVEFLPVLLHWIQYKIFTAGTVSFHTFLHSFYWNMAFWKKSKLCQAMQEK